MTAALLLDLDDTLYPQAVFLAQAWQRVAEVATDRLGPSFDGDGLVLALQRAAAGGSDRGGIIDRALAATDGPGTCAPSLVEAFRAFLPTSLPPYAGVADALDAVAGTVPVIVVTDGVPGQQRAKLRATGLGALVDAIVCTDEAGRAARKPHPHGFLTALSVAGASARESTMVGDRPDKDVAGAVRVGLRAIRVRQGEYADEPDHPSTWVSVAATPGALALVGEDLERRAR